MLKHCFPRWNLFAVVFLVGNIACAQNPTPLALPNGDFEAGLRGWTAKEKVAMSTVVPEAAHSGKAGLRVFDDDSTAGSNLLSERIPIRGGQNYRLHFWLKTAANESAVLQFRFYDAGRKTVATETTRLPLKTTNNRWMETSFSDRAPQAAASLAIWIHSYSGAKATLDFDDFTLEETQGELTGVAVPQPGAADKVAEIAPPKTAPRQSPPYIIIKADDLRNVNGRVHARWKKFAEFVKDRKIHASIGIISTSLEGDNPQYIAWIKEQQATGLFEFWNHGYVHEPTKVNEKDVQEFQSPYEEQKRRFIRSQQLAREKLGFPFVTFGAPSNSFNADTTRVLREDPETKVWLYGDEKETAGKLVLGRVYPVNIENPLFVPSLEKFIEGYNKYPKREYFVIQGHAAKWDDARFEQFTKIVDFLIGEKAIFVTPSEYATLKSKSAPN